MNDKVFEVTIFENDLFIIHRKKAHSILSNNTIASFFHYHDALSFFNNDAKDFTYDDITKK